MTNLKQKNYVGINIGIRIVISPKGFGFMSKNTTTLPVIADNPLDGTEFNNKFIFRSNEFLNASQGIIEGENPLSSKYRDMTINEQRLFMLTLLKMTCSVSLALRAG